MEPGLLTSICLTFKEALLPLAPQLVGLLEPSFMIFLKLAFVLLLTGMLFGASGAVMGGLFLGTLYIGATHFFLRFGWQIADGFFRGTVHVAQLLGIPAADPSSLVDHGWNVAQPVFNALDAQGTLSFITSPLLHMGYEAGGWCLAFAFHALAIMEVSFLLMSYVLVATGPLFCLWMVLPVVNQLALKWASLVFATMSGLMVTLLLAKGMEAVGQTLLETMTAHFAVTGLTLLNRDWLFPVGVGVVLTAAFIYIPLKFAGVAGGVAMDLLGGVQSMIFAGAGAVSQGAAMARADNMAKNSGGGNTKGGGGGGASSSNGMGPAQQPRYSAWQ